MLFLTVRESGAERTVRTDLTRVVIGAGPSCDLRLSARGVAPRHAVLRGTGYDFEMLPLDTPAGVHFEGRRTGPRKVRVGDTFGIGAAEIVVEEWALEFPVQPSSLDVAPRRPPGPPGFDEALYLALRRSPPWFLSAGAHGVAVVLLLALAPTPPPAAPAARLLVAGVASAAPGTEDAAPVPGLEAASPPVSATVLTPDEPLPPPPNPVERGSGDPADDDPSPADPGTLGIGGGVPEGFGRRVAPKRSAPPPVRKDLPDAARDAGFGEDGAAAGNRAAAEVLEGRLGGEGGELARIRALDPRRIVVLRGAYDSGESLFAALRIRHEVVAPEDFALTPLPSEGVLFVDCGNRLMDAEEALRVRTFVEHGGFLCTTDWALVNVIEPAFPEYLRAVGGQHGRSATVDENVPFHVAHASDPLVHGLDEAARGAVWWVEDRGFPFEVVATHRVRVLVESPALARRYASGALAATFRHGRGHVLHLLGHLWQKKGNVRGAYAMQRLVTNFLLLRARSLEPPPGSRREGVAGPGAR